MSPVVITLVSDGSRCLLSRQPSFPPGMFSALSGFCDVGKVASGHTGPWGHQPVRGEGWTRRCYREENILDVNSVAVPTIQNSCLYLKRMGITGVYQLL